MPIYEFECEQHGRFDELRGFSASGDPAECPACGASCPRAVSLPRAPIMDRAIAAAHERNERSQHEPAVHRGSLDQHAVFKGKARRGHVCSASCNHGGAAERKAQSLTTYNGPRQWVIEHTQGATVG
ncbi:MAG: zinc ribbon domain-containing protein [Planctomycetes bacterium]|nr:zinc ribbon domain-containing protein [Planctomycetota bacterium]